VDGLGEFGEKVTKGAVKSGTRSGSAEEVFLASGGCIDFNQTVDLVELTDSQFLVMPDPGDRSNRVQEDKR
jgi:hypothetical protein